MKSPFHIMIIPTLGCPSKCHYCWSSDETSPKMSIETVREITEWLKDYRSDQVTITFHGGEPLLAGAEFYRQALPLISGELAHLKPTFALQSNLWLLTPELAQVLAEYRIPIGSSIDGPEEITDAQRGKGYFEKTMRGYEIARANGLEVRFICTFTNRSVEEKEAIFNFFLERGFPLKLHPALPSLRSEDPKEWALEPEEYGQLLVYLLDRYLENLGRIEVMNINDLCKCIFTRRGTVCTFVDCMGTTLAVGPDGSIYPCYRFIGMPEYVMGNVRDRPTQEDLAQSEAWKLMHAFKEYVDRECAGCSHIKYCRGGCPYNAIAPTDGEVRGVDPHCIAYKRIFDEITDRLNEEMYGSGDMEMGGFGFPPRKGAKPGIMSILRTMATK
ncbi:TIGR04083 family peptide-modifying radical SAM enzyme [Methanoculleus sp. Wushi-C6]|uniref:TIGR04083 family peptide-modifying radical SAM enzyme n=1 Tax=Methanoculleus caldifontis TaxID=2651577 RepID=A0ABU3X1B8_9EURY|nr:TIGR04083 family peptide-modifying radical SAM enzyme [Methanoculleus sp. Wushi-C6]MDV2481857.1 TIGR04083 family peptide-modifying radical SAM enzyme [Methanoculleus sp. Wushi-C6]